MSTGLVLGRADLPFRVVVVDATYTKAQAVPALVLLDPLLHRPQASPIFSGMPTLPRYGSGCPCAGTAWAFASSEPISSSPSVQRAGTGTPSRVLLQCIV
ncbi:MAG: hypothetical protein VW907_00295, partial [Opitutae bacterium]